MNIFVNLIIRLDKYLAFNRKFLDECFRYLSTRNWETSDVQRFNQILIDDLLFIKNEASAGHMGLKMHLTEIYLEELSRITEGKVSHLSENISS